ncbi:hypothetical protein LC613_37170 [Nostoc sphaeroides CHAB 2801]|uniref:hypothetical protein n=1 Tax=Nostoc sphaeroides TaxID=446679 RepID=UPI001E4C1BFB|nr:hypothetical protein [Nostoc sphaeroides]MCC5633144.1 hypothetical protein [Nostoc sphaeroides CHAB 2801]
MSEEIINAQESQGFVNNPKGYVKQHFGDRKSSMVWGNGNIDKSNITNIILNI